MSILRNGVISKPHLKLLLSFLSPFTGVRGVSGNKGEPGSEGLRGFIGPQGPVGPQGLRGPVGPQGATGLRGFQGPQGGPGPVGGTGSTGRKIVYILSLIYKMNACCWKCMAEWITGSTPSADHVQKCQANFSLHAASAHPAVTRTW